MLDYKVNELKKQIEPRENEVKEMKEQVHEVRRVDLHLLEMMYSVYSISGWSVLISLVDILCLWEARIGNEFCHGEKIFCNYD